MSFDTRVPISKRCRWTWSTMRALRGRSFSARHRDHECLPLGSHEVLHGSLQAVAATSVLLDPSLSRECQNWPASAALDGQLDGRPQLAVVLALDLPEARRRRARVHELRERLPGLDRLRCIQSPSRMTLTRDSRALRSTRRGSHVQGSRRPPRTG